MLVIRSSRKLELHAQVSFQYKIGMKMSILSLTIFVGTSEFGENLEESKLFNCFFYFSMCYVTEAEDVAFIFIMGFN